MFVCGSMLDVLVAWLRACVYVLVCGSMLDELVAWLCVYVWQYA